MNPVSRFAQGLERFAARSAVSAVGGMLLLPALQASTFRIETLAHAVVTVCRGKELFRQRDLASWLTDAGKIVGHNEDPAEDVFASRVIYEGRNYRVLEGLSEGGCFHLQLILKVVERMPDRFKKLKDGTRACLELSEAMCERAGVNPFEVGEEHPLRGNINTSILRQIRTLAGWVTFSPNDLTGLGITTEDLELFLLQPEDRDVLPKYAGDSALFRKPILRFDSDLIVALPTAIGPAIRTAVIEECKLLGPAAEQILRMQHLTSIVNCLLDAPFVQQIGLDPLGLSLGPVIASTPVEFDPGYWVQLVLVVDDLAEFEKEGLLGSARNSEQAQRSMDEAIEAARKRCEAAPGFKAGLSFVVLCGFGRGQMIGLRDHGEGWLVKAASAYDAEVLGWRSDFSMAELVALAMAERDLESKGFEVWHVNGLLAQIGNALGNRGHLIPHEALPDGMPGGMIMAPTNGQLAFRVEYHQRYDKRTISTPEGDFLEVRKEGSGTRSPGGISRIYMSVDEVRRGRLRAAWARGRRTWWIECRPRSEVGARPSFSAFEALRTWMERIGPVLDEALPELPDILLWDLRVDSQVPTMASELVPAEVAEIKNAIDLQCDPVTATITTSVKPDFWRGLSNADNRAEAALVEAFIRGALQLARQGEARAATLTRKVVADPHARQLHAFAPQDFRDHVRGWYDGRVVYVSSIQDGAIRIGLGWSGIERPGGTVRGVAECTAVLNAITLSAEEFLCNNLAKYDRRSLVIAAIRNHEAAEISARRWKRTSAAMIALSDDEAAIRAEAAESLFKLNGISLASRVLIESGLHHCPETGGMEIADLDLSRLSAWVLMIVHLGGCSDAIHYEAMKPEIKISPAGEVQINHDFFDHIMDMVGKDFADLQLDRERPGYDRYLQMPSLPADPAPDSQNSDFEDAWEDEFGVSLSTYRLTVDAIENLCLTQRKPWLTLPRTELIRLLEAEVVGATTVVERLESVPRGDWRRAPDGYDDADRQPWRFRRRLSLARCPLVRLGIDDDADVIVVPGMVRDGFAATAMNMYDGTYDPNRLRSAKMRRWAGKISNVRGREFQEEVADEMRRLGWSARTEVKFGEIFGQSPEDDPGDIDVLVWHADGRINLLECKHLLFAKTPSEVAKQLSNFRGTTNDRGKLDRLAKHLNRWAIAKKNPGAFSKFTGLTDPVIKAGLIFPNTVPMQFAVERMSEKLWVGTKRDLGTL